MAKIKHATYQRQLSERYNQTDLIYLMPTPLAIELVNTWRHYQRGMTVSQIIEVLKSQFILPNCNYDSLQLALEETQPEGVPYER